MEASKPLGIAMVGLLLISTAASALQSPSEAVALLEKADNSLAPRDVRFELRIENVKDGKVTNWSELTCCNRGADKFLMVYRAPPIMVGQAQLKIADTIYIYVKKADKTTQVSAKTAFFNSLFTQEDVMSAGLSALYDIKAVEESKLNGRDVVVITLEGKTKNVAYGQIRLFLAKDSQMPLRREYLSFSRQMIKIMTIDKVESDSQGRPSLIMLTMQDAVRKNCSTRATIRVTDRSPIPDSYFSRNYLKIVTQ